MFGHLLTALILFAALPAACVSNPTPHPAQPDAGATTDDAYAAGAGDADAREVCDDLGGMFGDDGVCDLGLESNADAEPMPPIDAATLAADVTAVTVSGDPGAYTFSVTIASGDSGCTSYADWWEVVTFEGELLYRRVLAHSHVDEQPFTRSGGPVPVDADTQVVVRAHRHPEGYVGVAMVGSVAQGFVRARLPTAFATTLEDEEPLPSGCER